MDMPEHEDLVCYLRYPIKPAEIGIKIFSLLWLSKNSPGIESSLIITCKLFSNNTDESAYGNVIIVEEIENYV